MISAGTRLGHYEILSPLGAGGMGEVYRARDTRLDRTVAIKVLSSDLSSSAEARQRFEREARTISQLSHPHICALYDVGNQDGVEFLVMEYLEGETLTERLVKGPLPLEQTVRFGAEIADALDKAHRHGIVHRDLKPGNIMLTKSGVKLLDFGLARKRSLEASRRPLDAAEREQAAAAQHPMAKNQLTALPTEIAPLTQEGTILGTLPYMAPEQLEGKEADSRTDIFALGAVLYEMATGRKAFSAPNEASLITAIMSSEPALISSFVPASPGTLDRVVKACIAKDPEKRWQNPRDVEVGLRWIEKELEEPERPAAARPRPPWRVHAGWAAVAIAAGVLLWLSGRSSRSGAPPPNPRPVIVLMDSPLPGRVYDPRTLAAGGTNSDDLTDALGALPAVIQKENTGPSWHREDQVVRQNPDLIVCHLSCLWDERAGQGVKVIEEHTFSVAESRLVLVLGYIGQANPRTRFLVYSRGRFGDTPTRWVSESEARLPVLRGRLHALTVPGLEKATFRDPETARLIRQRISEILGLGRVKTTS